MKAVHRYSLVIAFLAAVLVWQLLKAAHHRSELRDVHNTAIRLRRETADFASRVPDCDPEYLTRLARDLDIWSEKLCEQVDASPDD